MATKTSTSSAGGDGVALALSRPVFALFGFLSQSVPLPPMDFCKMNVAVNLMKTGTAPFVFFLMWYYNNYNHAAQLYFALHGSYGIIWVVKDFSFPDPKWQARISFGGFITVILFTLVYWMAPWLLISSGIDITIPRATLAIFLYVFGVTLMVAADCQKYYTLKFKKGLITDGMFAYTRNPNYLGEMMLYGAFAIVAQHNEPWYWLAFVWGVFFMSNMIVKDKSISRYPEWEVYKQTSGLLIPSLCGMLSSLCPAGCCQASCSAKAAKKQG